MKQGPDPGVYVVTAIATAGLTVAKFGFPWGFVLAPVMASLAVACVAAVVVTRVGNDA